MVQDYELKKEIIEKKTDLLVRSCEWSIYKNDVMEDTGEILPTYGLDITFSMANAILESMDNDTLRVCHNLNNAYYRRKKTLQNKVDKMIQNNDCVFLTLTFNNETLSNTNQLTRRKYVTRYLKSQFSQYIANIDYGKKNEREHYHAIIVGKVDFKKWTYGAINGKNIINKNSVALAKYVTKITHHALKSSNKQQRVIYSR